ncbi:D-alanyl-D-alanine carboxypeptidase/D-alanyl-D-alanine-endopeptidase [Pseudalkalibacillus hwajinpoensis]|uniref:D-alanyl-D-alanine carboxypeptidase/D-alanyl-D-alanine endopeptidase n=1 Tax=Guptibacillus hwajinpoensis TaxID=208199 RepID=UPI00325B43F4
MNKKSITGAAIMTTCMLMFPIFSAKKQRIVRAGKQIDPFQPIHTILNDDRLKGAIAGVSIRSRLTGKLLFDHHGDTRLTPASNMKLLTAAAALQTLGPEYQFTTEILTDQAVENGQTGDLYLKGKGDPTLLPEDFDEIARTLKKGGINRINNLIGDEYWFDDQYLSEDIIWSDEHEYYGAQVSALTASPDNDYDSGTVKIVVTAGAIGEEASVTVFPETEVISIVNHARTSEANKETDISIHRTHGTNTIIVEGTIAENSPPEKSWIAVWEPAKYALNLFANSLKKNGIEVVGFEKVAKVPEKATVLFEKKSMSLSELLIPFMKLSNNGHAEVLIKEMGKVKKGEGSFEAGLEVVKEVLREEGLNPDEMSLRDGSGISQVTLIQPNQLTLLLYNLQQKEWFEPYFTSLPIAGVPDRMVGGTLRERFRNTVAQNVVHAKTGTLIGVTSLSGYIVTEQPLIFSIILNKFLDEEEMEEIENEIVIFLAQYKRS